MSMYVDVCVLVVEGIDESGVLEGGYVFIVIGEYVFILSFFIGYVIMFGFGLVIGMVFGSKIVFDVGVEIY